jgi:hypothetical protein
MSLDFIAFVLLIATIFILLISVISLKLKNRRLAVELLQSTIDHNIILTKFAEELKSKEDTSIEKTDGFLKFISESRDLAFEYIEKVQESLIKFKTKVDPEIKYMLTYGAVSGDNLYLKSFRKVEKAYTELMYEALPPEENKKN